MKKLLTSIMAVMFVLLIVSSAAFANDMKLYHNDNDHYSILVPSDLEYQDVRKINDSELQKLSFMAISKTSGMIYIQKFQQIIFPPIEIWDDNTREKFIQGVKESKLSKATTFQDSGQIDINSNKFLWLKFSDFTQDIIIYSFVHNDSLYSIGYLYPTNVREEILPKIKESLNSLKFDDIRPNWYWIDSNDHDSTYIDTNNITLDKDLATNILYKTVPVKIVPSTINNYFAYYKIVFEFKSEKDGTYCRIVSMSVCDANDKLIKYTVSPINPASVKEWKNVTINENMAKIADLLFEKNQ